MGIFRDELPGHEGYAIGFVTREGCPPDSGLYRELEYPRDRDPAWPLLISAGCECGWRSPRWKPLPGTTWSPFTVDVQDADDARVRRLWAAHADEAAREPSRSGTLG